MNYKQLVREILDMAHTIYFEETVTDAGLYRFEQLIPPYYGICNVKNTTWCIYKGGYKTPLTTILIIDTEENGIFEKFLNIYKIYETNYELYHKRTGKFTFREAHENQS